MDIFRYNGRVGKATISSIIPILLLIIRKIITNNYSSAHNLNDSFEQLMGSKPTLNKSFTNLYVLEIEPKKKDEKDDSD